MDSNYNLGGLIARIKEKLDDQEFSDETITHFINDAYFEVFGDSEFQFLERMYKTETQGPNVLPLPCDFQTIIAMTATGKTGRHPLTYMPSSDFFETEKGDGSKNYAYTVFGNTITYDLPDISEDLDEDDENYYRLDVYYMAKPMPLVKETDRPLIPYEFGEILVLGALARCERRRDNFDYAGIYENKQEELLTNLKLRYCPRQLANANRAKLPVNIRTSH